MSEETKKPESNKKQMESIPQSTLAKSLLLGHLAHNLKMLAKKHKADKISTPSKKNEQ